MNVVRLLLCGSIVLWLAGCASTPGGSSGVPPVGTDVDLSSVPPAIPKDEPLSRYGNPDSYTVFGKTYHPMKLAKNFVQIGLASWYGRKFHGQRTSSGETYNMYRMTAAHKTLPIPCYVRVTNLHNHKQVIVRVNDRGPFHGDRIIDLSYVAALKLGIVRTGTAPVMIETVTAADMNKPSNNTVRAANKASDNNSLPPDLPPITPIGYNPEKPAPVPDQDRSGPGLYLQAGAFAQHGNARQLSSRLRTLGIDNVMITPASSNGSTLYHVRVGPFSSRHKRRATRRRLTAHGIPVITVQQHVVQ